MLAACAGAPPPEAEVPREADPLIEYRIVHDTAGRDLEQAEYQGEVLYLERSAVLSDRDLQVVRPLLRDDRLLLELEFTPEGARRLERVTGANIGRRMAMLLAGRVRSAPVIRTALGAADVPMTAALEMPADEAELLAELIRGQWPEGGR